MIDHILSQRRILLFSILFLICFLFVAFFRDSFSTINLSVNLWSASINNGFFTLPAQIISIAFDTVSLVILSIVLAVFLFVFHYRRFGLLLLGAMAGDLFLVQLFKTIIMSPRPLNPISVASGYSFPSGHATSCVIFFGVLTYFVWKNWGSAIVKASTGLFYVSITSVVSFDRIYLNVHWLSDILGSIFLGAFWVALCILLFNHLLTTQEIKGSLSPNTNPKETTNLKNHDLLTIS